MRRLRRRKNKMGKYLESFFRATIILWLANLTNLSYWYQSLPNRCLSFRCISIGILAIAGMVWIVLPVLTSEKVENGK